MRRHLPARYAAWMVAISRVGDFTLRWGESVRWDDRRGRLYFVDCGTQKLHWLDDGEPPLLEMQLPSLPTGVVLTEDDRLVVALEDGLHVVDVDSGSAQLLTSYPPELGARANDANADLDGNLITGTLNLGPGPGSYWWYSVSEGWRQLDDGIGNANGPVVLDLDGEQTLVIADTHAAKLYAYPYDGAQGKVGERSVFADVSRLDGMPDGASADSDGGVWSCVFGAAKIARYTWDGMERVLDVGVELPSDVTFGGPGLDRLFFVSLSVDILGTGLTSPHGGGLMAVDDVGSIGRPEPRFRL
jgi:L-arabinonolactonase